MTKNSSNKSRISLHYKNSEKYFSFSTNNSHENISIDTEDAVVENLKINDYESFFSSNKNANILVCHNGEMIFKIMGNISKEEMIKIAENAEILL